ncbi:hypothetical protein [Brevibacillus laterosporus]|uniref:hypothetical protein n=1 Tax=Brevibacillus laterosporus TaxID=1465 RepID=UPI001595A7FD|nr:hypothetical protein [Brevibacillus laterosporus]MCG7319523.1 hypothetical protein [Brevibacillus laterosporus]
MGRAIVGYSRLQHPCGAVVDVVFNYDYVVFVDIRRISLDAKCGIFRKDWVVN